MKPAIEFVVDRKEESAPRVIQPPIVIDEFILKKLEAKLKAKGFVVMTISSDELDNEPAARAYLKEAGITTTGYIKAPKDDDAFIRQIDPKWGGELPALVLYDKTSKKVKVWKGETAIAEIETAVSKLL